MAAAAPLRILLVAEDNEIARGVVALLAGDLGAGVRTCLVPERAVAEAEAQRPAVVLVALASLAWIDQHAPALREANGHASAAPMLIALCDPTGVAGAARLCRQGVIDEYVQHFPMPLDAHRLATSVRLAARVAAVQASRPVPPQTGTGKRRRPLVVVVEDDETLHALVEAMLAPDVELVFESDGRAALERIQATIPDLVLMDVVLPGSDGIEITEQLKATAALAAIPVVMLTGEARFETLVRSMQAGAADFVVKPFTRDALVAKIQKFLPASA